MLRRVETTFDLVINSPLEIAGNLYCRFKVVWRFFGFRHSGDATYASGRQGVRDAEPNGGVGNSTTLYSLVRSELRGFRRLRP